MHLNIKCITQSLHWITLAFHGTKFEFGWCYLPVISMYVSTDKALFLFGLLKITVRSAPRFSILIGIFDLCLLLLYFTHFYSPIPFGCHILQNIITNSFHSCRLNNRFCFDNSKRHRVLSNIFTLLLILFWSKININIKTQFSPTVQELFFQISFIVITVHVPCSIGKRWPNF